MNCEGAFEKWLVAVEYAGNVTKAQREYLWEAFQGGWDAHSGARPGGL